MNSFDIDGVIFINDEFTGVYPGPNDIIITGRSIEEKPETEEMLLYRGINNKVYYNPLPFVEKTRESSGIHKGNVIKELYDNGVKVNIHFEDDEKQIKVIKEVVPWINVIHLVHNLTNKENVRRK